MQVRCEISGQYPENENCFTVEPVGTMVLRSRLPGDEMRLWGGTRSLKNLLIDKKIPAARRDRIPVIADEKGILGVYGIGVNRDRISADGGVTIIMEEVSTTDK